MKLDLATIDEAAAALAGRLLDSFQEAADAMNEFAAAWSSPLPRKNPRATALAAKQRRGTGPPSSSGWRGRERTTKYQRR